MVHVERTKEAPPSLIEEREKNDGKYNKEDVVNQLIDDFSGKCYICNMRPSDIQVEHLIAHKGDKDLKFDWENLFLSCPHCNSIKNQRQYESSIIDCCKVNPEDVLEFYCEDGKIYVESQIDEAASTAMLVTDVFNMKNTGIRIHTSEIRTKKLLSEMTLLYKKLEEYKENDKNVLVNRTIRGLLEKESEFAAFKRYYVKKNKASFPKLQTFLA